jgi:hypothetical protein
MHACLHARAKNVSGVRVLIFADQHQARNLRQAARAAAL